MPQDQQNSFFAPSAAAPAAEFNESVDAENKAGSRVLLAQHPRPSGYFRS